MKRILITGAGGSPATNFVRSLRAAKEKYFLVGTDCDKYYAERSETDKTYLVPMAKEKEYIPFLNDLIQENKLEFMHVQNDVEMAEVSAQRDKLNINTFLPSDKTVQCCMDKFCTYQHWQKAGLPQPKNIQLMNEADLEKAFAELGKEIWIRDSTGAGGRGSIKVDSFKVAKNWIDFKQGWGKYLAAEYLSPDSVTWMSIWKDGELVVAQGRKRLYWELAKLAPSGISGATGGAITYADPKLDEMAQKAVLAVDKNPNGIFSVDLTYNQQGVPVPTEINIGRFFTTHLFFTECGLNMPGIYVKLAYSEKIPPLMKKINPLSNNKLWIRGVDFLPVLSTMEKVEAYVQAFEQRKKQLSAKSIK